MKVALDRRFPVTAGAEAAWRVLSDVEAVASCMPGAKITEKLDERHYKGTISVKVGPATLAFRGDIEVVELAATAHTLRLVAKGTDTSGTSVASMDLTARVEASGDDRCDLVGHSEASIGGKAATFGGRMMDAVADQIIKQFAANFAARVEAQRPAAPPSAPETSAAESTGGEPAGAREAPVAASSQPPPAAKPLNAFALAWAVIRDWLRGLFRNKAT